MQTLLFIHGIGVRGDAWFSNFDLISRMAKRHCAGLKVEGCRWGDPFGARLCLGGKTIPGYTDTGDASLREEDASRERWFLLSTDPLLELRIAPPEAYLGEIPGLGIFARIPKLAGNETILNLLEEWSSASLWPGFVAGIVADAEWRSVIESLTANAPAMSEKVARSITAAYLRHLRRNAYPGLIGTQRDQLKDKMIGLVGGPHLGVGDWLLSRLTDVGRHRRGGLSDATTPGVGDVIRYQARGAEIRNFIEARVMDTGASILLAHSLGGIAAVDWLASSEYAKSGAKIDYLITVGSQAPYFYEIDALISRKFGSGLPETFPTKWLNFYDRADFLSYMAEPAFRGRVRDVEVSNGQPFPESHSAYWNNDSQVWREIAHFLAES